MSTVAARERAAPAVAEAPYRPSRWAWVETLRTLGQRFREDRLGLTAGSLTFSTLVALVPLFTVMLAVFSAFPIFASFQGALEKYFLQSLVPETIARPVMQSLTQFASKASRLGSVGLLVFGATAVATMLTIDRALNQIWRVARPRPIAQRVLVYWAALTLGPLIIGVSLSVTSYAVSASRGLVGTLPVQVSVLIAATELAVTSVALAALYHYVPNTAVKWRHAVTGGLFAAAGFMLAKRGLAWYVDGVPTYAAVYGAFATLPILLLWIYVSWVVVLLGAVVAAYAPSLYGRAARRAPTAGWRFELAVAVLGELARARSDPSRGLALADLARRLGADPLQVEPLLGWMAGIDWVARLDEEGQPRYVLLCNPATTSAAPLVAETLLANGPATQAFRRRAGLDAFTLGALMEGPR